MTFQMLRNVLYHILTYIFCWTNKQSVCVPLSPAVTVLVCHVLSLFFFFFPPPLSSPSSPHFASTPQPHICAPRFIPGSFWRGVPRRAQRRAGQSRRLRRGSDSLAPNQRGGQRLRPKPHGEPRHFLKFRISDVSLLKVESAFINKSLFRLCCCSPAWRNANVTVIAPIKT